MGLMPAKDACSAQPDARGNLIRRDLHSTPVRSRTTERHKASRSLRWSVFRGRLTATHPCRETHRGSVGTPTLTDCLWPVMDSQTNDVLSLNNLRALLPSLLTRFARSLRKGTPLNRQLNRRARFSKSRDFRSASPASTSSVNSPYSRVSIAAGRRSTPFDDFTLTVVVTGPAPIVAATL